MSYTSLHYHIVFSTKERRPYFDPDSNERLNAYFGGIIRNMKAKLHRVNSTADHVHLAVGLHPSVSVSYSGIDKVMQYIANQQAHHKKLSFEEELVILLKRHHIDYDPKYVFK